jgi:hypothetical protein
LFTKHRLVLALAALLWAGIIAVGASYLFSRTPPTRDVTTRLNRAGRSLNVLVPAHDGHSEQMLSIYADGHVTYFLPEPQGAYTNAESQLSVTLTEWQAVASLLGQWCQARPEYPSANAGELVYDVGWVCPGAASAKQLQIPSPLLPPALRTLLERIPPQ